MHVCAPAEVEEGSRFPGTGVTVVVSTCGCWGAVLWGDEGIFPVPPFANP